MCVQQIRSAKCNYNDISYKKINKSEHLVYIYMVQGVN